MKIAYLADAIFSCPNTSSFPSPNRIISNQWWLWGGAVLAYSWGVCARSQKSVIRTAEGWWGPEYFLGQIILLPGHHYLHQQQESSQLHCCIHQSTHIHTRITSVGHWISRHSFYMCAGIFPHIHVQYTHTYCRSYDIPGSKDWAKKKKKYERELSLSYFLIPLRVPSCQKDN